MALELSGGYGAALLRMLVALVAVGALAALVLRLLRRRVAAGSSPLRVVARLGLEPRRSLYLVEAAGRMLLVGVGDGGIQLLAELDPAKVPVGDPLAPAPASIADAVRRAVAGVPPRDGGAAGPFGGG